MFKAASQKIVNKLGEDITYIESASGQRRKLKGVFDYAYIEAFESASREPVLTLSSDDITPSINDQVYISGTTFTIVAIEPDGIGVNACKLVES